ncbi:MAG: hypothetical protein EOP07_18880 [Proteobacteria bacterium]|nr:MAG: hypothetical protein EOP07_18880 [Pseudomonadota bacterium]
MLLKYMSALLLAITTSLTAYGQTAKTLCPKVLNASGINTGLTAENLSGLYETMDASGAFNVLPEKDLSSFVVEPEVLGKPSFASRSGVRLVKLFPDSEDFVSINLFWTIDSHESLVPNNWPKILTSSKTTVQHSKLLDPKFPVRGIRISASKTFGNVWYLLTRNSIESIGKLEFLTNPSDSIGSRMSYEELAKNSATLESLEFYDSANGKFIPCNQVLAKDYDSNCYNFNSQLNPNLWKTLRDGETFYMQMILPLEKGYLLQTYEIGGSEENVPKLIQQKYESNLSKFKISADFF